jgi:hypothetical protein
MVTIPRKKELRHRRRGDKYRGLSLGRKPFGAAIAAAAD